jgi:molybdopterin/thiamine biosynthesis adenylyltransferase/rhodanese-related sulfurtransferase
MSPMNEYYQSHEKLSFIGKHGQQQLRKANVVVIGAGGLGCPCLQYLAGSGIGNISIIDFDTVDVSNLHRQILYNIKDIGKPKATTAVEKLSLYNPNISFKAQQLYVDETNVLSLIENSDVIVDCTDNFQVRYLVNDACVFLEKPLVYGAIHKNEGHFTVFNYRQSPTLRCLFPESEVNDNIQSCADIGAYNITTGIIGLMMANEVIKIILKHEDVLASKLVQVDVLNGSFIQVKYKASADGRQKSIERFQSAFQEIEISPASLSQKMGSDEIFSLIDVREEDERLLFNIGGTHIPLKEFLRRPIFEILPEKKIIVYCQSGERSLYAARSLRQKGLANVYSLQGGMDLWRTLLINN